MHGNWPGSIIDSILLEETIGAFLRTHRDGRKLLEDWLASVPPDRTELQYLDELERCQRDHDEQRERALRDAMRRAARIPEGTPREQPREFMEATPSRELRNIARYRWAYAALELALPEESDEEKRRGHHERTRAWQIRLLVGLKGCGAWWPLDREGLEKLSPDRLDCAEDETLAAAEHLIESHRNALAEWHSSRAKWWAEHQARRAAVAESAAAVAAPEPRPLGETVQ